MVEAELTVYIKCRATARRSASAKLARSSLAVEDVLEDSPTAEEGDVRITGGITYAPMPSLEEPWVKAVLGALRAG